MGYYITFDGGSGTGKGTVIKEFENYLTGLGKKVKILRDNEIAAFERPRRFDAAVVREE